MNLSQLIEIFALLETFGVTRRPNCDSREVRSIIHRVDYPRLVQVAAELGYGASSEAQFSDTDDTCCVSIWPLSKAMEPMSSKKSQI